VSCATCGIGLPEGATACTVCDPWAIPAAATAAATATATATATAFASPAAAAAAFPVPPDVPKWILRMAKRHPPTNVGYQQLERAWRNTKVVSGIRLASYGVTALACFFGFVVKVPALAVIFFVLAAVGYIGGSCYTLVLKRSFWLGRAVALAGAQPALGYAGLARIPAIAKLTASLPAIRVVSIVIILLRVFLTDDHALPTSLRDGSWALYFLFFGALTIWTLRLLADAHKDLARRLVVRR
jgi:hypothetical protein